MSTASDRKQGVTYVDMELGTPCTLKSLEKWIEQVKSVYGTALGLGSGEDLSIHSINQMIFVKGTVDNNE